jgi:arylsulfatase A-like enzyme
VRILYIDVDTLRADHTGPGGYARKITPNLDMVAQEGVVMTNCFASDSPCAPSRAAFTSVQFGITSGAIGNFGPASEIRMFERGRHGPFFGGHLYRNGIYTASSSCFAERHMAYWFAGNFREMIKPSLSNGDDEDGSVVADAAIDWLQRHGKEDDWFLQVHFWDPHIPYLEEAEWVSLAAEAGDVPTLPDENTIEAHREIYGPHSALDLYEGDGTWSVPPPRSPNPVSMPDAITSRADFELMVNGYDGAIAYFDHNLGNILDTLTDLGIYDETAIVVTSDHGECLGENGCYGDHPMANEASHHVPMVVRWPGVTDRLESQQRKVPALVYQFDICPTLCEMLGLEVPPGWEAESFAPAIRGEPFHGRSQLVFSHGAYTYQRALRTHEHLYIRTLHPGLWRLEHEQLYEIAVDPHMQRDLAVERTDEVRRFGEILEEWRQSHLTMAGEEADPMEARRYEGPSDAYHLPSYLRRLESTGRSHLAQDLVRCLDQDWVTKMRW